MSATCHHLPATNLSRMGDIVCRLCGWIYRIGLAGTRWVDPKERPIDG